MPETNAPPPWSRLDSATISAATVIAAALRFWHLGSPAEPVYDETRVLRQAHAFLNGWAPPYSTHPPAGKMVVALSVSLFGNSPWGWRAANALVGTALVPLTYLLARRLFLSRFGASIAAGLILCEGFYLVASRLAMINIVYVTSSACAYLFLWRFVEETDSRKRRLDLAAMGVALGLFVGTKVAISEVGVLLVLSVIAIVMIREEVMNSTSSHVYPAPIRIIAAYGILLCVTAVVYLMFFLPYFHTEWSSIANLIAYHRRVLRRNVGFPRFFENSSPAWSWPLLLSPYAYWKRDLVNGNTEVIWCGGNPLLWWGIPSAVLIASFRASARKSLAWLFIVVGYLFFFVMWFPIHRYLFIYCYMPALYFGLLALAGSLEECWVGNARPWEEILLLAPVFVCLIFSLGKTYGGIASGAILTAFFLMAQRHRTYGGKFVFVTFASAAILLAVYFFPIWTGVPISEAGYMGRMWLHGTGLVSWL